MIESSRNHSGGEGGASREGRLPGVPDFQTSREWSEPLDHPRDLGPGTRVRYPSILKQHYSGRQRQKMCVCVCYIIIYNKIKINSPFQDSAEPVAQGRNLQESGRKKFPHLLRSQRGHPLGVGWGPIFR